MNLRSVIYFKCCVFYTFINCYLHVALIPHIIIIFTIYDLSIVKNLEIMQKPKQKRLKIHIAFL
jgi:hypothetical protein